MPSEADIYDFLNEFRSAVLASEAAEMERIGLAYLRAEDNLAFAMYELGRKMERNAKLGIEPSRVQLFKMREFEDLHAQVVTELTKFNAVAEANIIAEQDFLAHLGVDQAAQLMGTQGMTPPSGFNRLPKEAVTNMIGFTSDGAPLHDLLSTSVPLTRDILINRLQDALVFGWSPDRTAREMQKTTHISLDRAMTIARTEQMRVWRMSSLFTYRDWGVTEYKRMSAHDRNTCLACLIKDGEIYSTEQAFEDHVNGRCTLVPIIPGVKEKERENGKKWLVAQPVAIQVAVMGKARHAAWKAGASFEDMATYKFSTAFGGSWMPTPAEILIRKSVWEQLERFGGAFILPMRDRWLITAVAAVGVTVPTAWVGYNVVTRWPMIAVALEAKKVGTTFMLATGAPIRNATAAKSAIDLLGRVTRLSPNWLNAAMSQMWFESVLADMRVSMTGGWEPLSSVLSRMRNSGFNIVDETGVYSNEVPPWLKWLTDSYPVLVKENDEVVNVVTAGRAEALTSQSARYVENMLLRARELDLLPKDVSDLKIVLHRSPVIGESVGPVLEWVEGRAILHVPAWSGLWGTPEDAARALKSTHGYVSNTPEGLLAHEMGKYLLHKSAGNEMWEANFTGKGFMRIIAKKSLSPSAIGSNNPNSFGAEILSHLLLGVNKSLSVEQVKMFERVGGYLPPVVRADVLQKTPSITGGAYKAPAALPRESITEHIDRLLKSIEERRHAVAVMNLEASDLPAGGAIVRREGVRAGVTPLSKEAIQKELDNISIINDPRILDPDWVKAHLTTDEQLALAFFQGTSNFENTPAFRKRIEDATVVAQKRLMEHGLISKKYNVEFTAEARPGHKAAVAWVDPLDPDTIYVNAAHPWWAQAYLESNELSVQMIERVFYHEFAHQIHPRHKWVSRVKDMINVDPDPRLGLQARAVAEEFVSDVFGDVMAGYERPPRIIGAYRRIAGHDLDHLFTAEEIAAQNEALVKALAGTTGHTKGEAVAEHIMLQLPDNLREEIIAELKYLSVDDRVQEIDDFVSAMAADGAFGSLRIRPKDFTDAAKALEQMLVPRLLSPQYRALEPLAQRLLDSGLTLTPLNESLSGANGEGAHVALESLARVVEDLKDEGKWSGKYVDVFFHGDLPGKTGFRVDEFSIALGNWDEWRDPEKRAAFMELLRKELGG